MADTHCRRQHSHETNFSGILEIPQLMPKKSQTLQNLEVVVLDCQATHNNPAKGVVFEIGWAKTKASESSEANCFEKKVESYLLKLPDSAKFSSPIKKIKGGLLSNAARG